MNPFENLIRELGQMLGLTLAPDANQSCRLKINNQLYVQIDLTESGDKILIAAVLGTLNEGSYRNAILKQAMCINGSSIMPRGIVAYSEKNDSLVLFHFFSLADINGEKLFQFLKLFTNHARVWQESLSREEIPQLQKEAIA